MKKEKIGITIKKDEDFSEWYTQVVQKAELADYSSIKGCMIIRPNAYSIWENIQNYFNERLKILKVKNAYFPLLVPESFFKREAEHAQGFKPEVAWLDNKEGGERLAIRPTSETIIYDSYSKWIRSYRDLPLRINQWANIIRWETKATRLFLRTREFLWQEGHCIYETEQECSKETLIFLNEYKKLCENLLAIAVITGKKSEKEKFAGAISTLSIDSIMPDGKSLQMGTSHNLGQGFAKSFNIKYLDKDEKYNIPWQNSWGVSTRLIGAIVMVHGDDKGLVLPPRIAYNKVVIIPIIFEESKNEVIKKAKEIEEKLKDFNPILDDRSGYTPGFKFNEWELKGIPIRIEIGPKDIIKNQVVLVRRDNNKKSVIKIKDLSKEVVMVLEDIHKNLFDKSKEFLNSNTIDVNNWKEFLKYIKEKKLIKAAWCGNVKCEDNIKDKTDGVKIISIPFDQPKNIKECIYCNNKGKYLAYFCKSY